MKPLEIAVVGAGVAGITAAHLLAKKHVVTLLERNPYLGGHTHTVVLESGPDAGTAIDTGFIVFNDRNYPTFLRFLAEFGLSGQPSDMSFGFSRSKNRLEYSSYVPWGLFAQLRNFCRPSFYRMIRDIVRFNQHATQDLPTGKLSQLTLGAYLREGKYSDTFLNCYLLPMGAAIWSTPPGEMLAFPAETFVRFFHNHGLIALQDRPHWMTLPGGSHTYIHAFQKCFQGTVRTGVAITAIRRQADSVLITEKDGRQSRFDHVIIATHADEALRLLEDPSSEEQRLLSPWRYTLNQTVLHQDPSAMPQNRKAWASWNYVQEDVAGSENHVSLTYHMNRLQNLKTHHPHFVTLNRQTPLDAKKIIKKILYTHPCYTFDSVRTQAALPSLNGKNRTSFCGSYFGYGFHEDAVKSAASVAQSFGITL